MRNSCTCNWSKDKTRVTNLCEAHYEVLRKSRESVMGACENRVAAALASQPDYVVNLAVRAIRNQPCQVDRTDEPESSVVA